MDDLLLQLQETSRDFYRQFSNTSTLPFAEDHDYPDFLLPIPELELNVPSLRSLTSQLLSYGTPYDLAVKLSGIHHQHALELAEGYMRTYRQSCLEILLSPVGMNTDEQRRDMLRLRRTGCQLYDYNVSAWAKELLENVRSRQADPIHGTTLTPGRTRFDSRFIPVLEAVFKESRIPSRAIKLALAKKSGMSIQQINVWFQNRRSRSKPTRSCEASAERTDVPSVRKCQKSKKGLSPRLAKVSNGSNDNVVQIKLETYEECTTIKCLARGIGNVLQCKDPPHAFPTAYPPDVDKDPFPCRSGESAKFPSPSWMRRPSHSYAHAEVSTDDMFGLIKSFSLLSLRNAE